MSRFSFRPEDDLQVNPAISATEQAQLQLRQVAAAVFEAYFDEVADPKTSAPAREAQTLTAHLSPEVRGRSPVRKYRLVFRAASTYRFFLRVFAGADAVERAAKEFQSARDLGRDRPGFFPRLVELKDIRHAVAYRYTDDESGEAMQDVQMRLENLLKEPTPERTKVFAGRLMQLAEEITRVYSGLTPSDTLPLQANEVYSHVAGDLPPDLVFDGAAFQSAEECLTLKQVKADETLHQAVALLGPEQKQVPVEIEQAESAAAFVDYLLLRREDLVEPVMPCCCWTCTGVGSQRAARTQIRLADGSQEIWVDPSGRGGELLSRTPLWDRSWTSWCPRIPLLPRGRPLAS